MSFSRFVALRYLWAKHSEAFITIIAVISVIGVALGVAVLTTVMSVMTGFEKELRARIVGETSHIGIKSELGRISGWEELRAKIQGVDGVISVSPYSYHQALIRSSFASQGVLLRGLIDHSYSADQLRKKLVRPNNNLFGGKDNLTGVVLGRSLASRLKVREGEIVTLLSPNVSSSPFGLVPSFKRFVVSGIYEGLSEFESAVAFVALSDAQSLFKDGNTIYGFDVQVAKLEDAPKVSAKIRASLGETELRVEDWTEANKALWDAMRLEKRVYFLVLLLIIVMASFSIISTLVMIVLEKKKDIAILMTLGSSPDQISKIFKMMGVIIGGLGTVLGLVLGLGLCLGLRKYGFPLDERIFGMSALPIHIKPLNFILVGICSFLICAVATIYPARRAASLEPSIVLRG